MLARKSFRTALVGGGFIALTAASAGAQQRVLLDWSGRVDSLAHITVQGGGARVSIQFQTEKLDGTVLGVEEKEKSIGAGDQPVIIKTQRCGSIGH